jgi:poly(3-hydroxybutyrate) depolymerase
LRADTTTSSPRRPGLSVAVRSSRSGIHATLPRRRLRRGRTVTRRQAAAITQVLGPQTNAVDADTAMWKFFSSYTLE